MFPHLHPDTLTGQALYVLEERVVIEIHFVPVMNCPEDLLTILDMCTHADRVGQRDAILGFE